MKAMYDNGNVIISMTHREMMNLQFGFQVGTEKLEQTALFMKSYHKAKKIPNDSGAQRTATRARKTLTSLAEATSKMVYS